MSLTPPYANTAPSLRPQESELESARGIGARIGHFIQRLKPREDAKTTESTVVGEGIGMQHLSAAVLTLESLRHVGNTDFRLAKPNAKPSEAPQLPTFDQSLPSSVAVQQYLRERHDMRGGRRPSQG